MNDSTAFGFVSRNAETAFMAWAPGFLPQVSTAVPVTATRHHAHAAQAVDAIAPQRKRRAAAATDPSVDRGFI